MLELKKRRSDGVRAPTSNGSAKGSVGDFKLKCTLYTFQSSIQRLEAPCWKFEESDVTARKSKRISIRSSECGEGECPSCVQRRPKVVRSKGFYGNSSTSQ